MSVTLKAPYPKILVTTVLPNPDFGDSIQRLNQVNLKRVKTGAAKTYVKSSDEYVLRMRFELTRAKHIELERFFRIYHTATLRIERDFDNTVYIGKLVSPLRAVGQSGLYGNTEFRSVELEFVGTRV